MQIPFRKYQGTGNDFIIIDNRNSLLSKQDSNLFKTLCTRRLNIGADGLILLQNHRVVDFEMIYFNSDGNESTMCGNGGRCIVKFAHDLGLFEKETTFKAIDGMHKGVFNQDGTVSLKMKDVSTVQEQNGAYILDTGSPHYIQFVDDIDGLDVYAQGKAIRYNDTYKQEGINVNFVFMSGKGDIHVRTYERGVENETLSCGTGVTAASIASMMKQNGNIPEAKYQVHTLGGDMSVSFEKKDDQYTNVWLSGPAKFIYKGLVNIRF